ncbi:hypothetical protein P3K85_20485 [Bacillus cytotoxicus]
MKIFRFVDDEKEFDSEQEEKEIESDIPCALEKKNLSKINEPIGRVEAEGTHLLLTLYPGIVAGDTIEVYEHKSGYSMGKFIASKPEPILDRQGIHHFEIDLKDVTKV